MGKKIAALPPPGSAKDLLFQQKVKALIKRNEDLRRENACLRQEAALCDEAMELLQAATAALPTATPGQANPAFPQDPSRFVAW
jgi:hypothetical protein